MILTETKPDFCHIQKCKKKDLKTINLSDDATSACKKKLHGTSRPVTMWGACFDQGQPHEGVGDAPQAMRDAGLLERLQSSGCQVTDVGDIRVRRKSGETMSYRQRHVAIFNKKVHDRVKKIVENGNVALTLGGDHSIGLGTVAGHLSADPDCIVVWVDAHTDIHTINTSNSGNMHGMPVSFNIKQLQESFPNSELDWLTPSLDPSRLVYIGLRDVEEEEKKILDRLNISAFYMSDVDDHGIVSCVEKALHNLDPLGQRNIHLSFDIDALDPEDASATGTPVRGGLTLHEGITLCQLLHQTSRLRAIDMVEVNPILAKDAIEAKKTVNAANDIILAALVT